MRILIVTDVPLLAELGAGQVAINLTEALRAQGHDVTLWSPHPLPPHTIWWQRQRARSKLDAFIKIQEPFDVIDCPAILITRRVSKSALVVSRSVQPNLLYLAHSLKYPIGTSIKGIIRTLLHYVESFFLLLSTVSGWSRAKYILCLGSLELNWMRKWFPWWQSKLICYFNVPSGTEQAALAEIRLNRKKYSQDSIRFLWIGRWVSHKGNDVLLEFITKWADLHPQDTFTIAGCGANTEKDCPSKLLHSGKVKILSSFERSQLYFLLANHDVGLFTSRVEGWGLVLNEMLESGMPVFATLAGGVPDLEPFFKETLRPFPPSLELTLDTITNSEVTDAYYQTFTWSNIAKIYQTLVKNNNSYLT